MIDVYNGWNDEGGLPEIKNCPFCGKRGILNDNGHEEPVIDPETGAYIDMDISEGDIFWCSCEECGAMMGGGENSPEEAIEAWNKRV